jgi:hypothetical protein
MHFPSFLLRTSGILIIIMTVLHLYKAHKTQFPNQHHFFLNHRFITKTQPRHMLQDKTISATFHSSNFPFDVAQMKTKERKTKTKSNTKESKQPSIGDDKPDQTKTTNLYTNMHNRSPNVCSVAIQIHHIVFHHTTYIYILP